ncbi:MAG: aldehyde dehydrogenase [Oscillospiraceae bacterium]|nr:aldehyde dehydrogenase [Oscillospiraceae bacterium]
MRETEIGTMVERQRAFFRSGATLPLEFRLRTLDRMRRALKAYQARAQDALMEDLGKCGLEAFMCETGLSLSELSYVQKHLPRWVRDRRVPTPLTNFAAKSFVRPMPYGVTLVMSPWNYPWLLSVEPIIDALAAGNTVILKPSAYSPATSAVLKEMLESSQPPEICAVVTGGREENQNLLNQKFDYIFFTGSQAVGREVLRRASDNLTPVTLELGGKSPVVVDHTADLELAARRIVFGKYLNSGQTCVAPDYVLCEKAVRERFVQCVRDEITRQLGEDPLHNPEYSRMVNEKHFHRVMGLIDQAKTVAGGYGDQEKLRIAPTVMTGVGFEDAVMGQEIFGPVLPVIDIEKAEDAIGIINAGPRPLALYVFTGSRATANRLMTRCAFGGGCVNDTIIHLATSEMGFGGMGESGMGAYHGKTGFDTFSHFKSIVDKKTWIDLNMRYRPYTKLGGTMIRMFLK